MIRATVKKTWRVSELNPPVRLDVDSDKVFTHVAIIGDGINKGTAVYGTSESDADHAMWTALMARKLRPYSIGEAVVLLSVKRGTVRIAEITDARVVRGRVFYKVLVEQRKGLEEETRSHDELYPTVNAAVMKALADYQYTIDRQVLPVGETCVARISNKRFALVKQSNNVLNMIEAGTTRTGDKTRKLGGPFKIVPVGHPSLRSSMNIQTIGMSEANDG